MRELERSNRGDSEPLRWIVQACSSDTASLRQQFDQQDRRHDRVAGKVALKKRCVPWECFRRDGTFAGADL